MQTKTFAVSGKWSLKGQQLPFFVKEIHVSYDGKNYQLKLMPFHSLFFKYITTILNGVSLTAESDSPFLVETKESNIYLYITHGKLGNALQALVDNNHIDLKTGEAILAYHHRLHKPTYLQWSTGLRSGYESISDEPPTPSFKLVARVS